MRPYLAIIKDSFREALASRVLWILLLLITVIFLAIAPIGWKRQLTSRVGSDDLRRVDELVRRLNNGDRASATPEGRVKSMLTASLAAEIATSASDQNGDNERMNGFRLRQNLAAELDGLLERPDFYDAQAWSGTTLSEEAEQLRDRGLDRLDEDELRRFNRLALEAAFPRHLRQRPNRSILFTYFHWDVGVPLPMTDEQVKELVETSLVTFMNFFVGVVGVFCAILVTASIIPNMFDAGSINLLLSKPISRPLLYLSKFVGGCSFVLINATYLIVGLWLIVGLRLGIWNSRLLLCIPVFLFLFVLYYSVSGLAGLVWRNTVVCITITILFWFVCFLVGNAKVMIDTFVHNPKRTVRVIPVGDDLLSSTENGQVQRWVNETESWQDVFSDMPSFGPAFISMRVGPIYDPFNKRLLQVERGWPKFRLLSGSAENDWVAVEVGEAPSETFALLNEQDGRPIAVSPAGIVRFRDKIMPVNERPKIFGFEIPVPGQEGTSTELTMEPKVSLSGSTQVAISPTSGVLYLWNDGELYAYQPEGETYQRVQETTISQQSQRAVLAAAGKTVVVARADGMVEVLDADSLELQKQFRPEANNPPRYVVASPRGSYFAVVFHTRKIWVYNATTTEPLQVRWTGQGDISAAAFVSDRELMIADRGNRVTQYQLPDGKVTDRWSPEGSLMQRISWFVINPIYTVFPRPGELQQTTSYILTGKETASLAGDVETLDSMYLKVDPWAPVWSSLAFTIGVLLISCFYITRQEF